VQNVKHGASFESACFGHENASKKIMKMRKAALLKFSLALSLSFILLSQAGAGAASATFGQQINPGQSVKAAPAPVSLLTQRRSAAGRRRFVPRRIAESNRRFRYTIKARYPQLVGARDASAAQFNLAVKDLITGQVNAFKKDFPEPDPTDPMGELGSSFDADYAIEYSGPDLISVSFGISTYFAGAAHPNHHSVVLNYDMKAGRALELSDLFRPSSSYLQTISAYTITALKKKLGSNADSEQIEDGAGPTLENYKSWNITRQGLSFTFDPYQVASYAEGEHVVVIPYAALRKVINMDGPVGLLAR
jgi:hypothetical protein